MGNVVALTLVDFSRRDPLDETSIQLITDDLLVDGQQLRILSRSLYGASGSTLANLKIWIEVGMFRLPRKLCSILVSSEFDTLTLVDASCGVSLQLWLNPETLNRPKLRQVEVFHCRNVKRQNRIG